MTLYEALLAFEERFLTALSLSSRRVSDPIATDWQKINNEFDLYFQAIAEGLDTEASQHIQNIIDILGDNGIVVTSASLTGRFVFRTEISDTITNGSSGNIIVGDITKHRIIKIYYTFDRNGLLEEGRLVLTNKADTQLNRRGFTSDQGGISLTKNIDGDDIRIGYTDILVNGDDTDYYFDVEYKYL